MKRIAFVGTVGAGKTTLFNALQGNYSLARKTQAVEFNEKAILTPRGIFQPSALVPRINYHAAGCRYADLCPRGK
jgi:ethanolamine utilization protein EutP (predicted NTPase)